MSDSAALPIQVNGGRLYQTTRDHLIDDSSLSIVDAGLINSLGGWVARSFPNLMSVVLCFSGDTQSDFSRLRQIQASVESTTSTRRAATGPTFPAMCINRVDIGFDPAYRPTTEDKYTANADGRTIHYQAVVLRYSARIYTQSYKLATRCLEALALNRQIQRPFRYHLPWVQAEPIIGNYFFDIPQIVETSSFPTQEAEGPVYVVSFNITARALLVDPPDIFAKRELAAIVYTTVAKFHYVDFHGEVKSEHYCHRCGEDESVLGSIMNLPNGHIIIDGVRRKS